MSANQIGRREIGSVLVALIGPALAQAALRAPFIFTGYQKQPRHRAADARRSQSTTDRVPAIFRSLEYTPSSTYLPTLSLSLARSLFLVSPRFFLAFFPLLFFTPPPTRRAPLRSSSPSFPLAFLRVVRAYEFDFTRFPSIERRKLFLEQPISFSSGPSASFFFLNLLLPAPRTARPVPFFFVSLADSLNAALKKRQLTRRSMRGRIHSVDR